jgi:hypothetical protein
MMSEADLCLRGSAWRSWPPSWELRPPSCAGAHRGSRGVVSSGADVRIAGEPLPMATDAGRPPTSAPPSSAERHQPSASGGPRSPIAQFGVVTRNVDAFEKLEQIGEGTYGYAPGGMRLRTPWLHVYALSIALPRGAPPAALRAPAPRSPQLAECARPRAHALLLTRRDSLPPSPPMPPRSQVYKARSRDDGSIVALKKIRMTKDQEKDGVRTRARHSALQLLPAMPPYTAPPRHRHTCTPLQRPRHATPRRSCCAALRCAAKRTRHRSSSSSRSCALCAHSTHRPWLPRRMAALLLLRLSAPPQQGLGPGVRAHRATMPEACPSPPPCVGGGVLARYDAILPRQPQPVPPLLELEDAPMPETRAVPAPIPARPCMAPPPSAVQASVLWG